MQRLRCDSPSDFRPFAETWSKMSTKKKRGKHFLFGARSYSSREKTKKTTRASNL